MRLFICALWLPAGKGLTSWLSFVVSSCEFATLIVSIPDLCTLTYYTFKITHIAAARWPKLPNSATN